MATVLVVGATGLLGPYLVEAARDLGKVIASGRTGGANSADLTELADPQASARALGLSLGEAVKTEAGDAIAV